MITLTFLFMSIVLALGIGMIKLAFRLFGGAIKLIMPAIGFLVLVVAVLLLPAMLLF